MTLSGYSLPRTPEGRASIVPRPPWHYVGGFIVVEFWADPDAVRALLPDRLDPHPDPGRCAAIFGDWQTSTDGGEQLLDPSRSQYKEFFVVVNALLDGEEVTTCPFAWVDRDFALIRGWIQGFPKKLGSIEITRHYGLDCAADPGLRAGARYGGTCNAGDRRLAEASVALERPTTRGPTHNEPPLVNVRHFPRLEAGRHDEPAVHELVRAKSRDRMASEVWQGAASLTFYDAPGEEHTALAPVRVGDGFRFTFAYTVDDLETVAEL